ncbi:MAG: hypothetical protein L0228_03975, partial [Planctomycetes bacterium]|nr:hypothetical protein [Planctomycetota bacterium]
LVVIFISLSLPHVYHVYPCIRITLLMANHKVLQIRAARPHAGSAGWPPDTHPTPDLRSW